MTESRRKANRKYSDKAYDRIAIRVHKGKRDEWQAAAASLDLSFAGLIVAAVEKYIADSSGTPDRTDDK